MQQMKWGPPLLKMSKQGGGEVLQLPTTAQRCIQKMSKIPRATGDHKKTKQTYTRTE